jgi:hypothetical protein
MSLFLIGKSNLIFIFTALKIKGVYNNLII